jgi:hypothetical protein
MNNSEFKTPDPALTGFLFARGFEHERLERQGSQIAFVFALTPSLKATVEAFVFNPAVPCRDMVGGYRRAMNLIRLTRSNNSRIQEKQNDGSSTRSSQ